MSVLDKWLADRSQKARVATSATSATNPNVTCSFNELDVATDLRQGCDKTGQTPDVAILSQPICDRNVNGNQGVAADVADVADVATPATPRFWPTSTVINLSDRTPREPPRVALPRASSLQALSLCCVCGAGVAERLTHWWGGKPCHRACGETAFQEAKDRGDYRRDGRPHRFDEGLPVSKQEVIRMKHRNEGRYYVRWEQIRAAGTTSFVEICPDREEALDFANALLDGRTADGMVYVDRQQRDDAGKWRTLETEEVSPK